MVSEINKAFKEIVNINSLLIRTLVILVVSFLFSGALFLFLKVIIPEVLYSHTYVFTFYFIVCIFTHFILTTELDTMEFFCWATHFMYGLIFLIAPLAAKIYVDVLFPGAFTITTMVIISSFLRRIYLKKEYDSSLRFLHILFIFGSSVFFMYIFR